MRHIYIPLCGQDDNLGDSVLRRGLVSALSLPDTKFHVLVHEASDGYRSALGLRESDRSYTQFAEWAHSVRASKGSALILNPGEANPRSRLRHFGGDLVKLSAHTRLRGGQVVHTGVGFRGPLPLRWRLPIPTLLLCNVVSWRDEPSRVYGGTGDVVPDWAFGLGSNPKEWAPTRDRDTIAVSLRFDRELPPEKWFDVVRSVAASRGLRIVTFAQVLRDVPRAQQLAQSLGGEYSAVADWSHKEMEIRVRHLYSRTRYVLSDRVHALIIGATEGATPIGSAWDPEKLKRTLAPAGLSDSACSHREFDGRHFVDDESLGGRVEAARFKLRTLSTNIHRKIGLGD